MNKDILAATIQTDSNDLQNCTGSDYCPCSKCDNLYVMEVYEKIGHYELKRVAGSVNEQNKKRVGFIPDYVKRMFYDLIDQGKSIGEAKDACNLGLGAAGQLVIDGIVVTNHYCNPYKR